ncbi:MAG: hypothetical protein ACXU82_04865 [Caulobacteraceae bacterium]
MRSALIGTALVLTALSASTRASHAQIVHPTCAEQWIAMGNSSANAAKQFGQKCILKGQSTQQVIDKAAVQALLVKRITPTTNFVAHPPKDIGVFCPKYGAMTGESRAAVWRALFLAMIPFESGFNNASMMLDGDQYSIGLFQMSVTDSCGLRREAELVDPDKNTVCAVSKMGLLASPGALDKPWAGVIGGDLDHLKDGAARYWHTLRAPGVAGGSESGARAAMIKATLATPGCR